MTNRSSEFHLTIQANRVNKEYFKDLFRYRELFYFFAMRDILVRYKQTLLGVAWAILRPLINMFVFALVFGKIANLPSDHVNYPLFVLAGMLPWQLFANCLVDASNSLIANAQMVSKIYFPRIILPISHIIVNFIDFSISLLLLFVFFAFKASFTWNLLLLPVFIGLALLFCLGTTLWVAAISVRYRDLRFIVPFIVQFGMFISPVGYGSFLVPYPWKWLYFLNPMAGIIDGFRFCCFDSYHPDFPIEIALSTAVSLFLLVTGFQFFRKMERILADII